MSIIPSSPAFMTVAKSNFSFFPETASNDLLLGVHTNSQRILFGVADSPSIMQISNSNINFNGTMQAQMMAVGGQVIGTGTNVLFSPIAPGFQIIDDNEGTGIGIGLERIQVNAGFFQWSDTTAMNVSANQTFNSSSVFTLFPYSDISGSEQEFSKNAVSFTGKYISQDFALANDSQSITLTGPAGMFCFGFDSLITDQSNVVENIVFRCYYNKDTFNNAFQNYYSLNGSQFVTAKLSPYTTVAIQYVPADNIGLSFTLDPSVTFRITRLSVIET